MGACPDRDTHQYPLYLQAPLTVWKDVGTARIKVGSICFNVMVVNRTMDIDELLRKQWGASGFDKIGLSEFIKGCKKPVEVFLEKDKGSYGAHPV